MFRPCHFLAVDRAHRRLVLSIRGSLELGDICTDLAARPAEWSFGGGLGPCHVH
ncbi:lipase_3 domain-containing protein, partial [Haematococcus lacustris]